MLSSLLVLTLSLLQAVDDTAIRAAAAAAAAGGGGRAPPSIVSVAASKHAAMPPAAGRGGGGGQASAGSVATKTDIPAEKLHRVHVVGGGGGGNNHIHHLKGANIRAHMGGHDHYIVDPGLMMLMLLLTMIVAQAILFWWKKKYYRSYQNTTLALLWMIPFGMCITLHYWRFLVVWSLFSTRTLYIMVKARQTPIPREVPRMVYSWFFFVYKACNLIALVGYVGLLCSFLVPSALFMGSTSLLLTFYGMYFGVLGRDCAEMCADRLASNLGFHNKDGLPSRSAANVCTICGDALYPNVRADQAKPETEETVFTLECKHQFHEFCLRGWTIVGKKDTCPHCSEKVNLRGMFSSPWETQSVTWAQLLDGVRYLIVWNPIILAIAQAIIYMLPHTHPIHHHVMRVTGIQTVRSLPPVSH